MKNNENLDVFLIKFILNTKKELLYKVKYKKDEFIDLLCTATSCKMPTVCFNNFDGDKIFVFTNSICVIEVMDNIIPEVLPY